MPMPSGIVTPEGIKSYNDLKMFLETGNYGYINDRYKPAVSQKTLGRNEPCSCGSGKKYKICCGK